GKVLHIGMTGGANECLRAVEIGGYETVQVPYNLLAPAAGEQLMTLAREKNVGVIVMRGLAGGKLTDKYINLKDEKLRDQVRGFLRFVGGAGADDLAHLAIQFVLAEPAVSTVILGSRKLERVKENLARAERSLPTELMAEVRAFARGIEAKTW